MKQGKPRAGLNPDTETGKLVAEFGRATPRPGSPASDPDSEETAVMAESTEKIRPRRHSGLTRRASRLDPSEQRLLDRKAARTSKKPKEHRAVGSVERKVYSEYIKANGVVGVVLYLVTLAGAQALSISTNVWLKNWSQVG